MPRQRGFGWVTWHPLTLIIHEPIMPTGLGVENVSHTERIAYEKVMSALVPEYQGYVENPDQ